jgi:spectinomycin phosphotransferase
MLEKPPLEDQKIIACLQESYEIMANQLEFLPLGADRNTAVYRAEAAERVPYFVKLRRGVFDETAVVLPRYLSQQGVRQIIAPLQTRKERLWAQVDEYRLVLYPFIAGQDGYQAPLSEQQWIELGAALRQIHSLQLPIDLAGWIRRETFSSYWRDTTLAFLEKIRVEAYTEPVAAALAAFLKEKSGIVQDLVERTERLGRSLKAALPEFVLCHSDIHAGNVQIEPGGALHIVDWDEPIYAPKERDLMCAGSGLMGGWHIPREEETLFYRGYGPAQVNQAALTYYRYERIIMDIAAFCQQLLLSEEGGTDRQQALHWLKSNFVPGGTIEIARLADRSGMSG